MMVLVAVVLLVVGFASGWKLHARKSIDYKKRWETATALYEQERINTLGPMSGMDSDALLDLRNTITDSYKKESNKMIVLESKKTAPRNPKASSLTQIQLQYLSDDKRYELEKERLDNGFEPFDNLSRIGPTCAQKIVSYRIRKGFG